jgi:probable F420-dependent oxidoreductase
MLGRDLVASAHAPTYLQSAGAVTMKFSMLVPVGHGATGEFQSAAALATIARALEEARVEACFLTDHPAPSARWLRAEGHDALDPFTALAFVAASSTRLKMFTNILVLPYRNPFLTAKAAATLQVLSGGRFMLGVGAGYQPEEFAALGVDFSKRGALLDEALEVIRMAWSGEVVVTKGMHFEAPGNLPRPVPNPAPPIWIGGSSDKAVERAARAGDGWCPYFIRAGQSKINQATALQTTQQLADKIAKLLELRAARGRSGAFDVAIGPPQRPELGSREQADRYLDEVRQFAQIGVTWVTVVPPSPSLHAYLEYVHWFGEAVIARAQR